MKKLFSTLLSLSLATAASAQGWPAGYDGVMLQGFYWDSYAETQWTRLTQRAPEMKGYFDFVWVPQSGRPLESGNVMGYLPYYYFDQNSSFGTEQELRTMISTFRDNGIKTMADVVVNHHNTDGWFAMPAETYKGTTYQLLPSDIVANDDGGKTATQAAKEGVTLSANNDEGEGWDGARDLDHKSPNVQKVVKAYVKYLTQDLGYEGFRYDMVKGFNGSHVADYNTEAGVSYSVGECWDGTNTIKNWINAADKKSAAFDFQFRYTVRNAANNGNWARLGETNDGNWPLVSSNCEQGAYRQWAVTFVENHDTEYRSASAQQDPLRKDTLAANAYLLAMPGTPCVFLKHYLAYPTEIKAMIDLRKQMGITNTSSYSQLASAKGYYAVVTTGTNGLLLTVVGPQAGSYQPSAARWTKLFDGYHYAFYVAAKEVNKKFVVTDKASGEYDGPIDVKLMSSDATSTIAYTTDGSTPSASNGRQVASGTTITLTDACTLKAVVVGASDVTERTYTLAEPFQQHDITVYVNADKAGWTGAINFYTWGEYRSEAASWPGQKTTTTTEVDGRTWYYRSYSLTSAQDYVNFVFSTGSGSPQTVDVNFVTEDTFFEISAEQNGGKNVVNKVTPATGIEAVEARQPLATDASYYSLQGVRLAGKPSAPGIYVHQGRKIVVR